MSRHFRISERTASASAFFSVFNVAYLLTYTWLTRRVPSCVFRGLELSGSNAGGTESCRSEWDARPFNALRFITPGDPLYVAIHHMLRPDERRSLTPPSSMCRWRKTVSHAPEFMTHGSGPHVIFPAHRAGAPGVFRHASSVDLSFRAAMPAGLNPAAQNGDARPSDIL